MIYHDSDEGRALLAMMLPGLQSPGAPFASPHFLCLTFQDLRCKDHKTQLYAQEQAPSRKEDACPRMGVHPLR